jgi:hypothetical protein
MPRNRLSDDARQPILQDNNDEDGGYQDDELEMSRMCCNPSKGWYRFVALIFMCLVGFGRQSADYQTSPFAYQ